MEKRNNKSFDCDKTAYAKHFLDSMGMDKVTEFKTEEISRSFLSGHRVKKDNNCESAIYLINGYVYKVLLPEYRIDRRDTVIDLAVNPVKNTPKIDAILCDKNGTFMGYKMEYLKNFSTLAKAMYNRPTLDERRKSSIEILESYKDFADRGYSFWDTHANNFLVKGQKGRIIDIDSVEPSYITPSDVVDNLYDLLRLLSAYVLFELSSIGETERNAIKKEIKRNEYATQCLCDCGLWDLVDESTKDYPNEGNFDIDIARQAVKCYDDETVDRIMFVLSKTRAKDLK